MMCFKVGVDSLGHQLYKIIAIDYDYDWRDFVNQTKPYKKENKKQTQ